MKRLSTYIAGSALMLASTVSAHAATLEVNNGILTGALDVLVDNTLYNVSFVDGTCATVYGSCTAKTIFNFNTEAAANDAVTALLNQVFIDGPAGNFDSIPSDVAGCTNTIFCVTQVAYGFKSPNADVAQSWNYKPGYGTDGIVDGIASKSINTTSVGTENYAVFTVAPPTTAVPEPETWAMMILGLGAVGLLMRRDKAKARFA